jgi:hypothetical protein
MELGAMWAMGERPVGDGESVLGLGARLSVAGKEAWSKGIGLRSKGVDGDGPADGLSKACHLFSDKRRANRAGYVEGAGTGEVVDAFLNKSAAGCVQVQRVAADAALEAARAHGALLQKSGREAALAEGGESADGVVAEHNHGGG